MAEPLKDLMDILHKSDDYIMALQKSAGPEEEKIIKDVDKHLDEAYKLLMGLKNRMALSHVIKKASEKANAQP